MQYLDFGKFIKEKYKSMGYTLNNFAFDCKIEPASLSKFGNGKSDIYFQNAVKIANGFNMPLSKLLLEYENTLCTNKTLK